MTQDGIAYDPSCETVVCTIGADTGDVRGPGDVAIVNRDELRPGPQWRGGNTGWDGAGAFVTGISEIMTDVSGYRRLAVHVLLRAFQDSSLYANERPRSNMGPGRRMHRASQVKVRDRESSIRFLHSNGTMLRLWCAWLDISVEDLRTRWEASLLSHPKV